MDLSKLKFNESDFIGKDVSSLPNRVVGRADYLKKMFDNVAKNEIALGRFNDLIDELEKIFSPAYFLAKSAEAKAMPQSNFNVSFGTPEKNLGGFEFTSGTHIKLPKTGIYLFSFNAAASYGEGKDVRFFIRPGSEGCTAVPKATDKMSLACCTAVLYKQKGESVYIECAPLSAFTLNTREISALLLCPM